ncbi:hypothetical protein [Corynebacterium sp. Marseille-P4321]|uniref:hypothetical protein n=1 Tax=Corynebacterium sp. Marseille-P4321 TaxID=2736603 RepID=UPI000893BFF5|nr:hypothetical protein [Corynebacterium sp. Marseille-P4321]OEX92853.1 hypothetical protein A0K93_10240 [Corynebacterium sp. BCW_4722]
MTIQPRPNNPIEQRKAAVRKYSRNAALWAGGGVVGGIAFGLIFSSWAVLILGFVVAVAGGVTNWNKVQRIVNHKDEY